MALKIRLARGGSKKRPFYRIVVAEATCPRDGRFVERVGSYNPILASDHADRIVLNTERVKYWMSVGAQPTDRVIKFFKGTELATSKVATLKSNPKQAAPRKKAQERLKAEQAKAEALAQAAEA
jgi:small subunit ribosomal protein S16